MADMPVTVRHAQSGAAKGTLSMGSGMLAFNYVEIEAEKERALASLATFEKLNPLAFNRETMDPWLVEIWVNSIEILFKDLYTLKRYKVYVTMHYWKSQ